MDSRATEGALCASAPEHCELGFVHELAFHGGWDWAERERVDPPTMLLVVPAPTGGKLRTAEQTPREWQAVLTEIMSATSAMGVRIPVDVNHATELLAPKGHDSPAYGWLSDPRVDDAGLWMKCAWTALGQQAIRTGSYRYLSPALVVDSAMGKAVRLSSVALVNRPAFTGLTHLFSEEGNMPDKHNAGGQPAPPAGTQPAAAAPQGSDAAGAPAGTETTGAAGSTSSAVGMVPAADFQAVRARAEAAERQLAARAASGPGGPPPPPAGTESGAAAPAADRAAAETEVDAAIRRGVCAPATRDHHIAGCLAEGGMARFRQLYGAAAGIADPVPRPASTQSGGSAERFSAEEQRFLSGALGLTPDEIAGMEAPA